MANRFYDKGINAFNLAGINAPTDTIKADLVSTAYTPNTTTDQFHSTVTSSGGIIAAGVALSSKSSAAGTLSAANVIWTAVASGTGSYIVVWKDTGTDATSPLICLFDVGTGLPVVANGGDITVAWGSGQVYTLRERLRQKTARELFLDWLRGLWGGTVSEGGIWLPEPVISRS